ncbi:hypothetical protein [Methylobacterium goesingense]|jgi:hypothetical protein|nr:hypothetical protein CFIICLFH_1316 [Methylobacterium goesingense]
MSETARQYAQQDQATRPQPGPLRDWLAAMKAVTAPTGSEAHSTAASPPRDAARSTESTGAEAAGAWVPRVVVATPAAAESASSDVSDLMAENIMLKAKLKVENDRYDALQGVIARELRGLRAHVEDELKDLEDMRAERDGLLTRQAAFEQEIRDLRVQVAGEAAKLDEVRSERDLWAARAEALAQPIFQKRSTV